MLDAEEARRLTSNAIDNTDIGSELSACEVAIANATKRGDSKAIIIRPADKLTLAKLHRVLTAKGFRTAEHNNYFYIHW